MYFSVFVATVQFILALIGVLEMGQTDALECINHGLQWKYVTSAGNFFSTGHIFVIIFQAILCERLFYAIPHKLKLFKEHHKEGETNEKEERLLQTTEGST